MREKRGILLLTTLFFVVVLIMMSVALFGLTKNNFQVNKDYFAYQKAVNNAENAIQTVLFWIQHQPNNFKIVNNEVSLNLTGSLNKILSNQDFQNKLPYFYVIYDMKTPGIIRSNLSGVSINISIDQKTDKNMYSIIFWPRNKSISQEGIVLFFGNAVNEDNVRSKSSANLIYFQILGNNNVRFYVNDNPSGGNVFPLYTSLNNGDTDVLENRVSPSASRQVKANSLSLLALSYSLVPGTNRYKVTYIEQQFYRGSLLKGSVYVTGSTNLQIGSKLQIIADNALMNNFISYKYDSLTLQDGTKQTVFSLTKKNQNNSSSIKGNLIVHKNNIGDNNTGKVLRFNSNDYSFSQIWEDSNLYSSVKSAISGDLKRTDSSFGTEKIRNEIVSSVAGQTYFNLPAGWYVFIDEKKVLYFPSTLSGSQVETALSQIDLSNPSNLPKGVVIYQDKIKINNTDLIDLSDYSFKVKENVKVNGNFVYITSYGNDKNNKTGFGNRDIKVEIQDNKVFYGENAGVVIDGTIQGKGTFVVTKDQNSSSSTLVQAMNYYGLTNTTYWQTYSFNNTQLQIPNYSVNAGDLVARFDQLRGGQQNVAIVVDNNFIINPLSQQTDTTFLDEMIMDAVIQYANYGATYNWYSVTGTGTKTKIFQMIMDNPDKIKNLVKGGDITSTIDGWKDNYKITINKIFSGMYMVNLWDSVLRWSSTSNTSGNSTLGKSITISGGQISDGTQTQFFSFLTSLGNKSFTNADAVVWQFGRWGVLIVGQQDPTDSSKANLSFYVFEYENGQWNPKNGGQPYTLSDANVNNVKGYIDNIDGSIQDDQITLDKLALGLAAAFKNDKGYLEGIQEKARNDIIKERLEGIYDEYKKFVASQGLTSVAGDTDVLNTNNPDPYYFPFLKSLGVDKGSQVNSSFGDGFSNSLVGNPDFVGSYLSDPQDVKLSGLIWVGNQLQAVTGNNNNLIFKGAVVVGKQWGQGSMSIKGTNNTTFIFDDSVLDLLNNMEAPSNMIPFLYKQYDRIYDR